MPSRFVTRCLAATLALCVRVAAAQASDPDDATQAAIRAAQGGDLPRAIEMTTQQLRDATQRFGAISLQSARVTGQLGMFQKHAGNYAASASAYADEIAILERLPDRGGEDYFSAQVNLGLLHLGNGHPDLAEAPLRRLLDWGLHEWKPDDGRLAYVYNDLGLAFNSQGRLQEAATMYEASLRIRMQRADTDESLLAVSHDNLGAAWLALDQFARAEPELLQALALFRRSKGPTSADTMICVANLAQLYTRTDRPRLADDLLTEVVAASALPGGTDGEGALSDLLRRRASIREAATRYAAAQADLDDALVVAERHNDADRGVRALSASGSLYERMGDLAHADDAFARAQDIQQELPRAAPELKQQIAIARARVALRQGGRDSATDFLRKTLAQDVRKYGAQSVQAAVALNNLAAAQLRAGELQAARGNVDRAIGINASEAPEGADLAANLALSGAISEQLGENEQAELDYRSALVHLERLHGPNDPRTDAVRVDLEMLLVAQGRADEALQVDAAHVVAFDLALRGVLALGDEQQGLAWLRSRNPFSLLATLGAAEPLARAALNYKGAVTDAVLAHRAMTSSTPSSGQAAALENWRRARRDLTQLEIRSSGDGGPESVAIPGQSPRGSSTERDRAIADLAAAEAEVIRLGGAASAAPAFGLSVQDVQHALPSGTALVDFIRYSRYLGKLRFEESFGALVYTSTGPVRWVPLGPAQETEQVIGVLRPTLVGADAHNSLRSVMRALHARLVQPLLAALPPDTRKLLVGSDGVLNQVSFATLLDPHDHFLAEKFDITYVGSARAVLAGAAPTPPASVAIYADPAFRLKPRVPSTSDAPAGYAYPELESLPDTLREADALRKLAAANGWQATLRTGRQATEADLRRTSNPGILHLATHGFYLPESGTELVPIEPGTRDRGIGGVHLPPPSEVSTPAAPSPGRVGQHRPAAHPRQPGAYVTSTEVITARDVVLADPMLRSAVALAGAQDTLEGWRRGAIARMDDDGVLNAQEAAALDLRSTWIVTLSSCDSGAGEAEPGEGVLGLRRGFLQAGARNVLTTLWPVSDTITATLISAFYARAFATGDAPAALAQEQRKLLAHLRARYGIEAAVRYGGAFVMTSQGLAPMTRR